jgi:hypothetical protein
MPAPAQLYLNIGVPPLLEAYSQPQLGIQNEIWMPGYWAYQQGGGYYWVPGTWVMPPQPGLYYTPGYWQNQNNGYYWNQGYWGSSVGYYGGVNYGNGYYGNGYQGGQWYGNQFRYNTAVSNVNPVIIRNVYVNRTVIVRQVNRWSYNGPGGYAIRPTPRQLAIARGQRFPLTTVQRNHIVYASKDRTLYNTYNHGRPPVVAVARPLNGTNRPASFKPVENGGRPAMVHPAAPAYHAPVHQAAPAYHAPVHQPAPAYHAPVHQAAPPVHQNHMAPPPVHQNHMAPPPVHHAAPPAQHMQQQHVPQQHENERPPEEHPK